MNECYKYADCAPFLFRGRVGDGVYSFDAWGRRRNATNWSYTLNANDKALFADRGYTGTRSVRPCFWECSEPKTDGRTNPDERSDIGKHLDQFGLINMNGRLYDPLFGRFLSPDNYVQAPGYTQSFNRYGYCWNNPMSLIDPTGDEFTFWHFAAGCTFGLPAWGGIMKHASGEYSIGQAIGSYFVNSAAILVGAGVSGLSVPFSNTLGIMAGSIVNSTGNYAITNGQSPISISIGVASYDFTNGTLGYFGKKGNSALENIGYGFGALANFSDMVSLLKGGGQNIKVNSAKTHGVDENGHPNDWWGHSSITDENGHSLVSVGPDSPVGKSPSLSATWRNSIKGAKTNWGTYLGKEGTWSVELNNVSTTAISKYASGISRWDLLLNSCVGHTTRSLWSAGVPTIYTFHPHMLNIQLLIRQLGIYSSPILYQTP